MIKFQHHSHCYFAENERRLPLATLLNQSDGVGITFKRNCFFSTRQNLVIIIVIWGGATKCVPVLWFIPFLPRVMIWVLIVLFKNTIQNESEIEIYTLCKWQIVFGKTKKLYLVAK